VKRQTDGGVIAGLERSTTGAQQLLTASNSKVNNPKHCDTDTSCQRRDIGLLYVAQTSTRNMGKDANKQRNQR
jgi:hypothetical protein